MSVILDYGYDRGVQKYKQAFVVEVTFPFLAEMYEWKSKPAIGK